ncbi:hypothetical protein AB6D63_22115 [Vibrio splendidus]
MLNKLFEILTKVSQSSRIKLLATIYDNRALEMGRGLIFKSLPELTILGTGKITLGNGVYIGKNVELRAYEGAELIIEANCKIDNGVRIIAARSAKVHIKEGSKIGFYSVINGGSNVSVGPNSSTYGFVYIQASAHTLSQQGGFSKSDYIHDEINIGESVLIGPHSVLNPGASVESNVVLDAHSVLSKKNDE